MAGIKRSVIDLIGSTPLIEVCAIERAENLKARLLVKAESFNPGGSAKDRAALAMIEAAEADGRLASGATIIEPTSGNTGIGLAWIGAVKGYRVILTMPETMSVERRNLLKAYGAEIVLTPGAEGMKGAIAKARELHESIAGSFIPGQFENPANPLAHSRTTAVEILADTDGNVDCFVAGVGTGGTVSGVGEVLKAHNPAVKIVAVEPETSAVLSGKPAGAHRIQGIGAGFVPDNYHASVVDEVVTVSDDDAIRGARMLARYEGLLCGISSGAAFITALRFAKTAEYEGKTIVALLPDSGERYLSTPLFAYEDYPL
ncbi:MAG: cysteine synthase A [Paramuribaculum sp.]|nr:cysteine synthase A [Paramuribaculum sp.]